MDPVDGDLVDEMIEFLDSFADQLHAVGATVTILDLLVWDADQIAAAVQWADAVEAFELDYGPSPGPCPVHLQPFLKRSDLL